MLALALAIAAAQPITVLVIVPLCDGAHLACGNGDPGNPTSLDGNLYWGAMYGVERFLRKQPQYTVTAHDAPGVLRELTVTRERVNITVRAYDGTDIDHALSDFVDAVSKKSADLVVWVGHDRLMDVPAPSVVTKSGTNVAVLACDSEQYFGPVLDSLGAHSVALTKSFMAPEAYLLDAMLTSVAAHGPADRKHLRAALVAAYAKWQRISPKAAGTVFSTLD